MTGGAWEREHLWDPITKLFQELAEGDVVTDGAGLRKLSRGVEGLLRTEVAHQYVDWPPESTTDGSVADLCRRSSRDVIEAFGLTYIDFGPAVFPFRAAATQIAGGGLTIVVAIGDTDPATGAPPRLHGPVLVPVRDDEGSVIEVELISGRRQRPVEWTDALRVTLDQRSEKPGLRPDGDRARSAFGDTP